MYSVSCKAAEGECLVCSKTCMMVLWWWKLSCECIDVCWPYLTKQTRAMLYCTLAEQSETMWYKNNKTSLCAYCYISYWQLLFSQICDIVFQKCVDVSGNITTLWRPVVHFQLCTCVYLTWQIFFTKFDGEMNEFQLLEFTILIWI